MNNITKRELRECPKHGLVEYIANNLKNFNCMKLAIKALKKHLKDNKKTISDLVYELTQAKLKIKQLTGE